MQPQGHSEEAILKKVEQPYERSALFHWLMCNYDRVVASAGGRRLEWTILCGEFAKEGLTDMTGKPPRPATARKTWQRVRKEKRRLEERRAAVIAQRAAAAAERAATRAAKGLHDQMPTGWTPTVVPQEPSPASRGRGKGRGRGPIPTPPPGAVWWNRSYWHAEDGFIGDIDNLAAAAINRQQTNLTCGRPRDHGLENFLGPKEEYNP